MDITFTITMTEQQIPELIGLLDTPSPEVRRLAASAIGKLAGIADAEAAVAALTRKPRALAGINGSSLKRRGMVKTIMAADLAYWEAEGWKLDDKTFDPAADIYTQVHRDFTRDERDKMGEIRDAMFRFVMGYMRSRGILVVHLIREDVLACFASNIINCNCLLFI